MTQHTRKARHADRRRYAARRRPMSRPMIALLSVVGTLASLAVLGAMTPDSDAMLDPGPAHQTSYPAEDVWPDLPPCMMEDTDAAGIPLDDDLRDYPHVDAYESCQWDASVRGNGDGTSFVVDTYGVVTHVS